MRRFVGTVPDILGLVSSGLGADLGQQSSISGRILGSVRGSFSSAKRGCVPHDPHILSSSHSMCVPKTRHSCTCDWFPLGQTLEDKIINAAPGFGRFPAPWGPRRAPGALGRAPARKIVQVAPKIIPGDQFEGTFVGNLCFWCRPQKYTNINDEYEAPQGQPSHVAQI